MRIPIRVLPLFIIALYLNTIDAFSQEYNANITETAYKIVQDAYGTDPVLINGKKFEDIYRNDLGHPYLTTDEFLQGNITVRNVKSDKLNLRYNIFDQTLVVSYTDKDNSTLLIIPPTEFVSGFSFNGLNFSKYKLSAENAEFCQNIFVGQELTLAFKWTKKRYDSYHNKSFKAYKYSQDLHELYVIFNSAAYLIKSNKSFIRSFKEVYYQDITDYLKTQKINLKKCGIPEMNELGLFCDNLLRNTQND